VLKPLATWLRVAAVTVAFAVVLVPPATGTAVGSADALQASLAADALVVAPDAPVSVRVSIRNPTADDISVPAWDTPARGVMGPLFRVTLDGAAVPYTGMLAKRVDDPSAADLVTVEAGSTRTWTVDLGTAWAFTRSGTYAVQFDAPGMSGPSQPILLTVAARGANTPPSTRIAGGPLTPRAITYANCTTGQETQASAAVPAADAYAAEMQAYFTTNRAGQRYTTWFGTFDRARWSTVAANIARIRAVTSGTSLEFTCATIDDCGGTGVYAYVHRNQPYRVYLCNQFWTTTTTGTDSRAGTLIHEIAHFNAVAGTYDHVYGQAGAANLAATDPAQAIDNSDNYEYFAENTPATTDTGAAFTADTGGLAFGEVAVGDTATRTLTLTSTGGGPALISTVSSGDASFQVTASTCSSGAIPAASTCTITVRFAPQAAGARTTSLAIASDAPAAPDGIALSGTGVSTAVPPVPAPVAPPAATAAPQPAVTGAAPRVAARPLAARRKALISPARLVTAAGLQAPTGSRVRIGRVPRGVTATSSGVRASRAGTFRIPITVTAPGGRPVSGTATIIVR